MKYNNKKDHVITADMVKKDEINIATMKDIDRLAKSIENIYELLDDLNKRLVQVANFINERVKVAENEPINSSMSREDITLKNHVIFIAKHIESSLRGDDENV